MPKSSPNPLTSAKAKLLLAVLAPALAAGLGAITAGATTGSSVTCATLQTSINDAAAATGHGEGAVIVLGEMCNAGNLGGSGVTLPAGSNFSIEGEPGTNAGFNGVGINGPLLGTAGSEEVGTMTLSNLTFEHADETGKSALSIRGAHVTLSNDAFIEDEAHGANAHAAYVLVGASGCTNGPPSINVTGSRFLKNNLVLGSNTGGGAGVELQDACSASTNVLEGNAFEGNTIDSEGTPEKDTVTGAGLFFDGPETQAAPVSQRGNVFDSNAIAATAPAVGDYGGGGEWLDNASLTSTGDRFSRNDVVGTVSVAESGWSRAAGLGVITPETTCKGGAQFPESTLEDDVVAGNAIGAGKAALLGGGGIWVGCLRLHVLDSTVTLNKSSVGAGIEGEPEAHLELVNSIVARDSGGNETAGFDANGGSLKATYSDVCATEASAAPLPGAGNLCADPHLVDDGNPSSFDVHEIASSPTIDAGSNALVPAALNTDFYGNGREIAGKYHAPACTPGQTAAAALDAPIVDMGATEFGPISVPAISYLCAAAKTSVFSFPSVAKRPKGVIVLTFAGLTSGKLSVRATFKHRTSVIKEVDGRRRRVTVDKTLTYGTATHTLLAAGTATLTLNPTKRALTALAHHKRLNVEVAVTFTAAGATATTHTKMITIITKRSGKKHHH
jgi:hypothetical protein